MATKIISFRQVGQFVWRYFRRRPWWVGVVLLGILIQSTTEVLWPYLFGQFTDTISAPWDTRDTNTAQAFWLVILLVINGACYWIVRILTHLSYDRFVKMPAMRDAIVDTFVKIQLLSTDWHENSFGGATVRKITRGVYAIESLADMFYLQFIPLGLVTCGVIGSMLLHWPIIGNVLIVGVLAYIWISTLLSTRIITPAARAHAKADTKLGAILADSITGQATTRSFGQEAHEKKRVAAMADHWYQRFWNNYLRHNVVNLVQSGFYMIFTAVVFITAVTIWADGNASVGDVSFIVMSFYIVIDYLKDIDSAIRNVQTAARNLEDMVWFADSQPQVTAAKNAVTLEVKQGAIDFQNVTFLYPNTNQAVYNDLSLRIKSGEKVALVGRSGSGKSTLVKLLQRLYDIQSGMISIDGQDIATVTLHSLHQNIALVPQDPILFHRPLRENIGYAKPAAGMEEIIKAAKMAHAHEFISELPNGYETLVGERGIKLSGGERQRVAIARALLADAPILILDEATSSLDSASEKYIQDALHHLIAERTAIIIAHRLSTIKSVDRILVFDSGKIVEQGTHSELLQKGNGIYQRMFTLQAGGFLSE